MNSFLFIQKQTHSSFIKKTHLNITTINVQGKDGTS